MNTCLLPNKWNFQIQQHAVNRGLITLLSRALWRFSLIMKSKKLLCCSPGLKDKQIK